MNMAIALGVEKSGRSFVYLIFFGFVFALGTLLMIVKTATDTFQESKQAKWPSVVATITQQVVRKYSGRHDVWRIESEVRYSVAGEKLTSSIRSRVTGSTEQRGMMRKWASQHPPGTPLPIRYDPQHQNMVVLDGGNMPESGSQVPGDWQMLLIFSVLSVTLVAIGRVLRGRREESGMLNHNNTY